MRSINQTKIVMKEAIKLDTELGDLEFEYDGETIIARRAGERLFELSPEALEEVTGRMEEIGWIGEDKDQMILHG